MIHYPRLSRYASEFELDLRLPDEYNEWVKRINPEIRESVEQGARKIQKSFELDDYDGSYPILNWSEDRGLVGILVGARSGAGLAQESVDRFYFHHVNSPLQALTLIGIISFYLNGLQNLYEKQKSSGAENETQKT
ncbi:hypothetical protein HYV49_01630 [Candidatus Pacearchaeota archaeon]|nr:hypothetical protein [Candidatus Pacearchaeota archaeon]